MSQATNWGVPPTGPANPTLMASRMNDSLNALRSLHRGATRPTYAVSGTLWLDDSAGDVWSLKMYDGDADDAVLALFDSSAPGFKIPFDDTIAQLGTTDVQGAINALMGTDGRLDPARLGSGTADATTVLYGDGVFREIPGPTPGIFHVRDEKPGGTNGGTFTQGAWRTRNLNTVATNTISGASLSADQFTLPEGTYEIFSSAPARSVNNHQTRLYNITDSETVVVGTKERTDQGNVIVTRSFLTGVFTISAQKTFEFQHYAQRTQGNTGFGTSENFGVNEVFTDVYIRRIG